MLKKIFFLATNEHDVTRVTRPLGKLGDVTDVMPNDAPRKQSSPLDVIDFFGRPIQRTLTRYLHKLNLKPLGSCRPAIKRTESGDQQLILSTGGSGGKQGTGEAAVFVARMGLRNYFICRDHNLYPNIKTEVFLPISAQSGDRKTVAILRH